MISGTHTGQSEHAGCTAIPTLGGPGMRAAQWTPVQQGTVVRAAVEWGRQVEHEIGRGWHWAVRAGGLSSGTYTGQSEQAGCTAILTLGGPSTRAAK